MAGYIGSRASVVSSGAERKKTFTITGTTTVLTGVSYTPTFVHVFHNGVRLVDGTDYTATNSTSITLTTAAENGDEIVVISYATFQVADAYTKSEADAGFVSVAGGTFAGNVGFTGNLTFTEISQLYGAGTQTNPFKGLDGANALAAKVKLTDGNYYVDFNGTTYLMPFMFYNETARQGFYNKVVTKAWMKVTSDLVAILSASTAQGASANVNAAMSSSGVITMDKLINDGCSTSFVSYGFVLPAGCSYNYARADIYRPHSIHQCIYVTDAWDSSTMGYTANSTTSPISALGATSAGQFTLGGTYQSSVLLAADGGGPQVSTCSWNSSIHAYNGGPNATTTGYTYDWISLLFKTDYVHERLGFNLRCASETAIAQTNTTHEWWIAA
jgi:hypothetical protein